jgi:hypothetical protein
LAAAYEQSGLGRTEALEHAWDVVGFYGDRGASFSILEDDINSENALVWGGLYLSSATLGLLDRATLPSGHPYSYPPELTTSCAFSRPYYFWMAAHLTHFLMSKGHGARTAVLATHLVGKLYQFGAKHGLRDPDQIYHESISSMYHFGIAADLAYLDAGALWAAGYRDQALNVDQGIAVLLSKARPLPRMTDQQLQNGLKSDLRRYLWFDRLMAPDAYVRSVW